MSSNKLVLALPIRLFFLWALCLAGISIAADLGGLQIVSSLFGGFKHYDVVIHFFLVGSLGFCAALASPSNGKKRFFGLPRLVWIVLGVSVIEETTQLFRELRGFSFADMAANVLGILVFSRLALMLLRRSVRLKAVSPN